jgi:putative protease
MNVGKIQDICTHFLTMTKLELLSPAKDPEHGKAAISHGADAVYTGAPMFSARKAAGTSVSQIKELARFAHQYNARVYVAMNTILFDHELDEAEKMIHEIYEAGADALIIQDMGILEMSLPPIPLFASTQTHNVSSEKVLFLEKAGFRRVILARELTLQQISEIREKTTVELESFVHGALCVSYSGQCYMSQSVCGRSGNRGDCAQPCRSSYNLTDKNGKVLVKDKHLISLKDLNLSQQIPDLINAGITSFKIEGRLKDMSYVINVV